MASRFVPLVIAYFTIVWVTEKTSAQRLESPCPRLFVYEPPGTETDRWYGIITLISDSDLNGVWLRVIFDRPSLQLGNWFGEVKTEDNKDYLIKNRNHKLTANTPFPIRFYIKYDPSNPVPRLESFRLNAKTVCPEGLATTAPPVASNQLYTNKEPDATSPLPPPQPAEPPSRPSGGNRPSFRPPESTDEDDYFQGDFSGFNLKPTGIGSNVECGTIAVQPRPLITYGQKTKAGEFPWHAALYHSRGVGLNYICGGSLISRYHVLTVAHCVSRSRSQSLLNPDNLLVYLGKYYLKKWSNPGVQDHQVSKIIRHPQYDSKTYSNDIAVIKLSQPAEFTDFVRPICLWEGARDFNPLVGKFGTVVGWGFDENGKLTEELTMLNMPIVSKDSCIYSFPDFFSRFTTSETYCAGFTNGTSVCNGDSGGGMVFQKPTANPNRKAYHLRGLVSVSVALQNEFKCDPTHYVVFTDVAKYLEFIKQAIRQ
ncbi:serine protease gd n-terminus [Holotrichia oblita]|uniref:Serine protease gd n-terminus n=1 Tax=Holotrichia oblita TaxID=644536 RepID=A0ACB9SIJ6_HOLOL|nr:serine protease gd n-terminus [Holotrichia oblita]